MPTNIQPTQTESDSDATLRNGSSHHAEPLVRIEDGVVPKKVHDVIRKA